MTLESCGAFAAEEGGCMAKKNDKRNAKRIAARLYVPLAASVCTVLALGAMAVKAPHAAGD